jgi:spoIIIJ-associated protein
MSKEIIGTIEELLTKMGVVFDSVEIGESELEDSPRYVINSPEASVLIGNRGENLLSLSHVLKRILSKETEEEDGKFFIDIGDYQNKRIKEIKNRAIIMGERARFFKKDIEMDPMSSYERMIVHSTFTDYQDLVTESLGEGRERRVFIKYKEV